MCWIRQCWGEEFLACHDQFEIKISQWLSCLVSFPNFYKSHIRLPSSNNNGTEGQSFHLYSVLACIFSSIDPRWGLLACNNLVTFNVIRWSWLGPLRKFYMFHVQLLALYLVTKFFYILHKLKIKKQSLYLNKRENEPIQFKHQNRTC